MVEANVTCSSPTPHSTFGALTFVSVYPGSVSIIAIILLVLLIEQIVSTLHEFTSESAFANMLVILEKELMIVGCTSFIFKSIQSSDFTIDSMWYTCLEFADSFVPITVFLFCIQGALFILMASYQTQHWTKGYRLHIFEILSQFYGGYSQHVERFHWIYHYFSPVLSQTEFRVIHILFCNEFHLERNAFEFDEYVIRVFEKFIVSIIEAKPENWIVVCVFVLINWLRIYLNIFTTTCSTDQCIVSQQSLLYTVLGAIIFAINLILVIYSRYYEYRYLEIKGIKSVRDYGTFLEENEDILMSHREASRFHKISQEDLMVSSHSPAILRDHLKFTLEPSQVSQGEQVE